MSKRERKELEREADIAVIHAMGRLYCAECGRHIQPHMEWHLQGIEPWCNECIIKEAAANVRNILELERMGAMEIV